MATEKGRHRKSPYRAATGCARSKPCRDGSPPRSARARCFAPSHAAAGAGASVWKLAEVSRHGSLDTLCGYVRRVDLFKEHAGASFL
jgi:hypothetical protein